MGRMLSSLFLGINPPQSEYDCHQFAELSNLHTHLAVRALRPANTRTRAIPYGYGFTYVSFPNYFFEIVGWIVICVMSGSLAGEIFVFSSFSEDVY